MKEYKYPNYCPDCQVEFRVFLHPGEDKPMLAVFCPFCGRSVICPKCGKPYYECSCDEE